MLLNKETSPVNLVGAWRRGAIRVGEAWFEGHVIISPDAIIPRWPVDTPAALAIEHLDPALAMRPEILLIGTGNRLVMPEADLVRMLGERGIGVEIMDTPAACRTYNVLAHEYRRVVAGLFGPGA